MKKIAGILLGGAVFVLGSSAHALTLGGSATAVDQSDPSISNSANDANVAGQASAGQCQHFSAGVSE